ARRAGARRPRNPCSPEFGPRCGRRVAGGGPPYAGWQEGAGRPTALPSPARRHARGQAAWAAPRPRMTPAIEPLGGNTAEPVAMLHRACFPEDPWDAADIEQI